MKQKIILTSLTHLLLPFAAVSPTPSFSSPGNITTPSLVSLLLLQTPPLPPPVPSTSSLSLSTPPGNITTSSLVSLPLPQTPPPLPHPVPSTSSLSLPTPSSLTYSAPTPPPPVLSTHTPEQSENAPADLRNFFLTFLKSKSPHSSKSRRNIGLPSFGESMTSEEALQKQKQTEEVKKKKEKNKRNKEENSCVTREKNEDNEETCGICGQEWEDITEEEELWLDCGMCGGWFHAKCIGYNDVCREDLDDIDYVCDTCSTHIIIYIIIIYTYLHNKYCYAF